MSEASEGLGKYVQLENDEKTGAKRGYIKDQEIAAKAAGAEQADRDCDDPRVDKSPEALNRWAEEVIKKEIYLDAAAEDIKKSVRDMTTSSMTYHLDRGTTERQIHSPLDGGGLGKEDTRVHLKHAGETGKSRSKEYDEFQKEVDQEKLDKLRKEIREKKGINKIKIYIKRRFRRGVFLVSNITKGIPQKTYVRKKWYALIVSFYVRS